MKHRIIRYVIGSLWALAIMNNVVGNQTAAIYYLAASFLLYICTQ